MIRLQKTREPAYLARRAEAWSRQLLVAVEAGDVPARRRLERNYNHQTIKTALLAETHGKCAYCESRFRAVGFARIEHIKPRREAPQLTFAWTNLTIACELCNANKSDDWDDELPLLNPYEDDPSRFLWVQDGLMLAWLAAPRGQRTIERLALNRAGLLERRRERLGYLQSLIERWRSAINDEERRVLRRALERELEPDKEYLLMVRGLVLGHASVPAAPARTDMSGTVG